MADITAGFLADNLRAGCETFGDGELAYLLLTSKSELPVRDRLAWALHQALLPTAVAAREWGPTGQPKDRRTRIDIAVLPTDHPDEPTALIQAKAFFTYDLAPPESFRRYVLKEIEADTSKASEVSSQSTMIFAIVLATHPELDRLIPDGLVRVVKYPINRTLGNSRPIRLRAQKAMHNHFEPLGPVAHGSLDGGTAFGVPVFLDYWVIGPAFPVT